MKKYLPTEVEIYFYSSYGFLVASTEIVVLTTEFQSEKPSMSLFEIPVEYISKQLFNTSDVVMDEASKAIN